MKTLVSTLALGAAFNSPPALAARPMGAADTKLPPPAIASPAPVERGFAPVNGLRIYYEVYGPAGGTPLVLLHGGDPAIETSWARVLPMLARKRRVIAFDQRGHGRTADDERPFTFEGSADDTAALLAVLKVPKADLMGFSNGASIAMQVAIRHPALVRRLVFASGMTRRDGLRPEFWQGMEKARLEDMPPEYVKVYRETSPHPEQLPSFFRKSVDRMLGFRDWPESAVRSVTAPTLVVVGDADVVRPEHAIEVSHLLPHARLAILPLTDHGAVLFARAGWLVPMVEAFLSDGSPAAPVPAPRSR
jgi:pimeloyl-ACP methyl ester carboxylesterase